MLRPYHLTWSARISGFFGFVLVIVGYLALTGDVAVTRLRDRLLQGPNVASLHYAGVVALVAGLLLIAVAVYSQMRFGPPLSTVRVRTPLWPPPDSRAWVAIIAFVVAALCMLAIVVVHVLFTFSKT
jgi:protein-S-isoprenylcysteine O-methyltransferase Ste14